ncbi:MAG: LPS export ABC transporter periplasmic protein LptC [Pseudomonadota bacterium]|nr:LPS export ABC transporter periplasmic protein LptC [Pseudomonadota bacterium]
MKYYTPKSIKVNTPSSKGSIKLIILFLLSLIILVLVLFNDTKKNSFKLDDQVFEGEYDHSRNFIKVHELKFLGYNNKGKPYLITANKAIKENKDTDKVILHRVKADILMGNQNWFYINTEKAVFRIKDKVLFTDYEVNGFYDDGSGFTTPSIQYDFISGIAKSEEGIVMFGKWGNIKSEKFAFNSYEDAYKFDGKAKMILKSK